MSETLQWYVVIKIKSTERLNVAHETKTNKRQCPEQEFRRHIH